MSKATAQIVRGDATSLWEHREGKTIFAAWHTGRALHAERPASMFDLCTTEVYHAEIFPLGTTE